ncbi:uncharacterized protein FIESC28_01120 [Fusarium coffeatum]|uniref:Xylanolytic transcriptional activator regulatory domain-containing protein n=1 Tax=Fusarium coffeatum TaxID=231269 RepID=A0A366SAV9_9HYPO|nr:uncharacterized protein FIESC28_01120 [Fusarium coffeatum]RBR26092.1 hypothetical protein FIESC28_01120 [Fusarium coffeatum]
MDMSPAAADEMNRVFELESKSTIRTYLDTYFDRSDIADCVFLHRATTIAEWNQGKLEKTLLKAICASALRLTSGYDPESSPAHTWIKQVQNDLTSQMGDVSVAKLQSLMLVIEFLFSMQFTGDVWVLVSIASRIAFTKRLNYERPAIDAVKQECLRRLMWYIYRIDKVFSGGIEDLTVCPTERMHIRLPSSQHNFQLGSRSKAPFLQSKDEVGTDLNVLAFLMRFYDTRDRVLSSTSPVTIRQQEKLHRRSKHAYAPVDEEEQDPAIRPPDQSTSEELSEAVPVEIPPGQDIWSFTAQDNAQDMMGSTGDASFESLSSLGYPLINYDSINSIDMVFGDQELGFPMDPFDLQMNAYTDSNASQY